MKIPWHFICHSLAEEGDISMIFRMAKWQRSSRKNVRICYLKMKLESLLVVNKVYGIL